MFLMESFMQLVQQKAKLVIIFVKKQKGFNLEETILGFFTHK